MLSEMEKGLIDRLSLDDPGLIGCRRRGKWTEDQSWRNLRGNAILELLGRKAVISTPAGPLEFYHRYGYFLLQFRGGPWQTDWITDFQDLWSLVKTYGQNVLPDLDTLMYIVHENQGEIQIIDGEIPDLDYKTRAAEIIEEYQADPPGRLNKSTARAARVCKHCPVKLKCDATDKKRGEDDDWGPSYPVP